MKVTIAATRSCPHCRFMVKYFADHGIKAEVKYIEECPGFVEEHSLTCSPSVLVDDKVVNRGMPSAAELEQIVRTANSEG